jgi:hypothetical protein
MAITYQAISGVVTKTSTTVGTLVLTEPAGSATDDLLVACISFRGATAPSIPTNWNLIRRTTVTGNTTANSSNSIGSGLMAWIKRGATAPNLTFGSVSTQQFPNLAFGCIVRISGQDLIDPIAGSSVNTLVTAATTVTTGAYTRSFTTATADDYIEIMLCMGGQEQRTTAGPWSTQQYITGPTSMTEIAQSSNTAGGDGSIAVARSTTLGDTTGGFSALSDLATTCRSSLIVASFGGPRPEATTARSFSVFV